MGESRNPAPTGEPRVVIAHDFMETFGGAERVTTEFAREFQQAPVVAILGRPAVAARMGVADRFTSLLAPRPRLLHNYRLLAPLYPELVDRLRLPEADVVLSSSYAFAHRLRTPDDAPRVCYSWGPLRFAWSMTDDYRSRWARSAPAARAFDALVAWMRASDRRGSRGVDLYLAPLESVAGEIERAYGYAAEVVKPPVDCDLFSPTKDAPQDHFLYCGRLVEPYKKVRMLVEAFNGLDHRLVIAGDGPARRELEALARPNIEFVGELGDVELVAAMRRSAAAVFPSRDDFGLVPVEVMACGRPVLAYAGGGARETVVPGLTGELFERQTPAALREAVRGFDPSRYEPAAIRAHALNWDHGEFRATIRRIVTGLAGG